jgi:serine phosphatase RsbU (regulator of sigma subunit)
LAVALPTVPDEAMIAELGRIATVIGYALDVAGRRTDRFERTRRTRPFSVAAEVQWHQLPARACATPRYQLAGDLEPAYEVGGDSFDWAVGADALTVVVTDAMGHALPAAMLSTLALAGLRQGRRAGMGLSGQARVADRALLERYAGEQFVTATLLQLDLCSGETRMVQAGSPDIYHLHDGKVRLVDTQSQLPLGMAEATDYQERFIDLIPGDRLVLVTDGVTEARNSSGEEFGDTRLADAITSTSDQRPVEAVPLIYRGLRAFSGAQRLRDDATVLCLDWLGPNPNL